MRSRITALGLLILAMLAGLFAFNSAGAQAATTTPVVWLVPHQDDEVLSYGADIRSHLQSNDGPFYAVLLTDGSHTGVCDVNKDGTFTTLEETDCTTQRDAEFYTAIDRLEGSTGKNITVDIPADRAADGELTKAYVQTIIDRYQALYPGQNVRFKGYSYKESLHCDKCGNGTTGAGHPDHDAIGEAMRQDWSNSGQVTDVRFYVKPSLWNYWPGANNQNPIGSWTDRKDLNGPLDAYGSTAPDSPVATIEPGVGQRSSTIFCEQYAGTRANPTELHNGKSCTGYNTIKPGGAENYVHPPGV